MMSDAPQTQAEGRDEKGRFVKGVSGNPGGAKAGYTQLKTKFRNAVSQAFDALGGAEWFLDWIKKNQRNEREFVKILVSMMPKEIEQDAQLGEKTIINIITSEVKKQEPTDNVIRI